MEREADGRLRHADSSARSSILTTPLRKELAVGVQHNCSYMVASCCAPIAADPTAAAAAGRAGRVESLDANDADPAAAANAAALHAARRRHSPHDGAAAAIAALRRLAHARTPRPLISRASALMLSAVASLLTTRRSLPGKFCTRRCRSSGQTSRGVEPPEHRSGRRLRTSQPVRRTESSCMLPG